MNEASMNTEVAKPAGTIIGTTKEEIEESKRGPKKKSWVKSKIGRIGLSAVTLGGLVGGTAYAINQHNVPSIEQTVGLPSTFDPNAIKSILGENNAVLMSIPEYEKNGPPLWDEQTRIMSMPLAIDFRDGKIRSLDVEKQPNPLSGKIDVLMFNGLETGDILKSPMDGEIQISEGDGKLRAFSLRTKDSQGYNVSITYATTPLTPLITLPAFDKKTHEVRIPIKKGDPIGRLISSEEHQYFTGQIQIIGFGPLLKSLNLAATTAGKAIVLK